MKKRGGGAYLAEPHVSGSLEEIFERVKLTEPGERVCKAPRCTGAVRLIACDRDRYTLMIHLYLFVLTPRGQKRSAERFLNEF